ncbi:MAG: leucyl aminopeptidase [Elusimicrobiota bacterium]
MLPLSVINAKDAKGSGLPLAVFSFEDEGAAGAALFSKAELHALETRAKEEGFSGKAGETVSFLAPYGKRQRRFVWVGLGKRADFETETLRRACGGLYGAVKDRIEDLCLAPVPAPGPAAEGLLLAGYAFTKYKKPEKEPKLKSVRFTAKLPSGRSALKSSLDKASVYAEAVCFARDLVNESPSEKTPEAFARQAKGLASEGVFVEVWDEAELRKLGMGAILGVSRGSSKPPCMLHVVYKPKGAKRNIWLVGKGILFDSGGLCLKSRGDMVEMKDDMAGAAVVLAVLSALPRLKTRAEVHALMPLAYNMPGPDALKPGDILRTLSGKTIEVLNTDAEGRLVLADALAYAARQKPDAVIDVATLTGAVIIALGSKLTGAMTNSPAEMARVKAAAKRADEPVWELPLPKEYKEEIKSRIADLKNIGSPGEAGAIIAGLVLQEFVGDRSWVHLDTGGSAWSTKTTPTCPAGGTGGTVRTLLEYLTEA